MKTLRHTLATAAVALIGMCASSAMAASTWAFAGGSGNCGTVQTPETCAKTSYTSAETSLNIDGVYAANNQTTGNAQGSWTQKSLTFFSGGGLGMPSDGTDVPNHALDNLGNTEGVVLNFGAAVALKQVTLGYVNTDSDISVFRYVSGSTTLASQTVTSNAASGWQLVGNYSDLAQNVAKDINSGNLTSSWWLITAYNQTFATSSADTWSQGNDFFKLLSVQTTCATTKSDGTCTGGSTPPSRVSEPASLALTSLALLGVVGSHRRRQLRQQA